MCLEVFMRMVDELVKVLEDGSCYYGRYVDGIVGNVEIERSVD